MNADPGEEDVLEGGGVAASCESASEEEEKDALRWWAGAVGEGGEEERTVAADVVEERWVVGRVGGDGDVEVVDAGGGADDTCKGCFGDHLLCVRVHELRKPLDERAV